MPMMATSPYVIRHCPKCGLRRSHSQADREAERRPEFIVCPTCGMDPAEYAYTERILADPDAVYRQEWREFQAKRQQERVR